MLGALEAGRGAILLSGHSYGFSRLVPPVLAQRGYAVFRTGMGHKAGQRVERWGKGSYRRWQYLNYNGDYWHHLVVLNQMRQALKKNGILHISMRGTPRGDPELEIEFWHKRFFLDPLMLRVIGILKAPVLPCFALCDEGGRLLIKIFPPQGFQSNEIMATFGPLYARYLREFPEFARIWGRVIRQKEEF